ncbi:hypothetical protein HPB48_018127 [Haemaphysalis longicornis]|uniref:Carboxylesterase type B domain-containing protein n=1 Tax=Haemaphysalis longicornis TaxID=44386 RepID=A0A9J6FNB4_HAELO|nr:hypothetical protein HPB48_018127 [Haemaphysalis longicornis]
MFAIDCKCYHSHSAKAVSRRTASEAAHSPGKPEDARPQSSAAPGGATLPAQPAPTTSAVPVPLRRLSPTFHTVTSHVPHLRSLVRGQATSDLSGEGVVQLSLSKTQSSMAGSTARRITLTQMIFMTFAAKVDDLTHFPRHKGMPKMHTARPICLPLRGGTTPGYGNDCELTFIPLIDSPKRAFFTIWLVRNIIHLAIWNDYLNRRTILTIIGAVVLAIGILGVVILGLLVLGGPIHGTRAKSTLTDVFTSSQFAAPSNVSWRSQPVPVSTTPGEFVGKTGSVDGVEVNCWLGIPYAESTAGNNRFHKPVPRTVKERTLAHDPRPPCPQWVNGTVVGSEDCLHVNVWAPNGNSATGSKRTLVLASSGYWFQRGSNNDPDWAQLAAKGNAALRKGFLVGVHTQ